MTDLTIRPLTEDTWPAFAAVMQAHGGVWGGCWCMAFHEEGINRPGQTPEGNRDAKEARVRAGTAHAALVFRGEDCLGWCQYGPPKELPRIKHAKAYAAGAATDASAKGPPDWRITCFHTAKGARGLGVAKAALRGALDLIAAAGGGVVEAGPEDTTGRKVGGSFLWSGTVAMFEAAGFARVRPLGKHHWLFRQHIPR